MPPAAPYDKSDLFAQYQILEELGDFPSYSLFKVKSPSGAIKLWKKIDLHLSSNSIETRLLPAIEKIQHPFLNAVSGSFNFPEKGLLFVESDFPLKTLRHRMEECKAQGQSTSAGIPISELFGYIAQAAEGIDYLNSPQHQYQGKRIAIYHRALSPDSLHLFDEKGKPICKVGDFGLAKPILDSVDSARHSLGLTNYDYSPPEFDEGITTSTSDQYSLATTYYELRTGKLPFTGSLLQKLQAQLEGKPDLSAVDAPERPALLRALSRDPHARFGSCREFVQNLQSALGGLVTMPINIPRTTTKVADTNAMFGSTGSSGWAITAKPVGKSGGSLFDISTKPAAPMATPAKQPDGWTLMGSVSSAKTGSPSPDGKTAGQAKEKKEPVNQHKEVARPLGSIPKPAAQKLTTERIQTPLPSAEGWKVDEQVDKDPPSLPPIPDDWTPGKVTVGRRGSDPNLAVGTPDTTSAGSEQKRDELSSKARETLELIKKRQKHHNTPPPIAVEKPISGGSKIINSLSAKPAPGSAQHVNSMGRSLRPAIPSAQEENRPIGNVAAIPGLRRASSPVAGIRTPLRRPESAAAPTPKEAVRSLQTNSPTGPPQAGTSLVTIIMVGIAAFCIGMLLLAMLVKK